MVLFKYERGGIEIIYIKFDNILDVYDYIYDDYDNKCYKYIITPPLNNDNLTYEENVARLNKYMNQQLFFVVIFRNSI